MFRVCRLCDALARPDDDFCACGGGLVETTDWDPSGAWPTVEDEDEDEDTRGDFARNQQHRA